MLRKTPITTHYAAVQGQAYRAASYTCTRNPPKGIGGDSYTPPVVNPPPLYHVFVPVTPTNPAHGETYEQRATHPGAGYTCRLQGPGEYTVVNTGYSIITIQNSTVCNWNYP
jgi:hypothetical protein